MDPLLSLENVCFSYPAAKWFSSERKKPVLRDFNLQVNRGDRIGILGRNGEGKSTLLRLLSGVIRPDSGLVTRAPNVNVALLALGVGFNPLLTGKDNVILSSMMMGISEKRAKQSLESVASFAELEADFYRPVRTYSAGMRSRLAFSTALIMEVEVLLIDEVLAVGDAHFKKKASSALSEKLGNGQTVILVSHSNSEIRRLCDKAVWLGGGMTVCEGAVEDVVLAYESS